MLPHPSPAVSIGGSSSSYAYPPQVGSCQDVESRLLKSCGSETTGTVSRLPEPPRYRRCDPRVPVSARLVSLSRHHRQPGIARSIELDDLADGRCDPRFNTV